MRKVLSILLAVCLLAGCLPLASLATEGGPRLGGKVGFENFPRDFRQSLMDFEAGPNGEFKLPIEEIQKVFPEAEDQRPTQTQWIYAVVRDLPTDVRDRYCVDVTLNGKQLARFAPSDPKSHSWWLDVEDGPTLIVGYFDNNDMPTGTLSLQLKDGEEPSGSPVTLEIGRLIFIVDEQPVGVVYGQSGESAALLEYTTDDGKTVKTWRGEDGKPIANPTDFPEGEMACIGSFEDEDNPSEADQLFVFWGVQQAGWNDELNAPIYRYNREEGYNQNFGMLPIDEHSLGFAIQTGKDQFQNIPISQLTASQGAHLKAIPKEQIGEDSKEFADYMALLTVDDFDKEYTISYTSGDKTYELHFASFTYGPCFYSKPELDNKNIINQMPYNILDSQPTVYLGIKIDPDWQGGRRVKSVELGVNMDDFTMEKVNDTFWKITMKKEAMTGFDSHELRTRVQWEHQEGEDRWVEDDDFERVGMGFWPESTIVYAASDLLGDKRYVRLEDVRDKLNFKLEMTVGEKKTIYPYIVNDIEIDNQRIWAVTKMDDAFIALKNTDAVTLSDVKGGVSHPIDVTAIKKGSAEITYATLEVTIYDKDGKVIEGTETSDLPLIPVFADYFGIPESEVSEDGSVPFGFDTVDGKLCLIFTDTKGVERAYPNVKVTRNPVNIFGWPEHNISITVKVNPAVEFTDVKSDAYYADPVTWAVENNVTLGTGGNKFNPDGKCTRDQIVTFLYRAKNSPDVTITNQFTDMPKNEEFQRAISWAVKEGVTQGVGGGKFGPGQTCTRVQAVTFMWRAAGSPEPVSTATFSDMPSYSDFRKAISWAAENNITTGAGGNKFDPEATCSRGQIVTFLYRAKNLK